MCPPKEAKLPIIYIAYSYRAQHESGVWTNVMHARTMALRVWQYGGVALCPHLNTMLMGGAVPDEVFLEGDKALLFRCDALWIVDGSDSYSEGVRAEVAFANEHSIPVLRSDVEVLQFIDGQHPRYEGGFRNLVRRLLKGDV